jgi:transcriptional regulator with XRE-family HTH domain
MDTEPATSADRVSKLGPTARTVAGNVRRLRQARGISLRALSSQLANGGRALSADAINKIENGCASDADAVTGRQVRRVDVDDLIALAGAFNVSPLALLLPWWVEPTTAVELTGTGTVTAAAAWAWAEGSHPLVVSAADPAGDAIRYRLDSRPAWARGQQ